MSIAQEIIDWYKSKKVKKKNIEPKHQKQSEPKLKTPLDLLFSFGNKLSPEKKLDFTYYMIWILFTAFVGMFIINLIRVLQGDLYSLIWCAVGFAISTLQYFNLSQMHQMRKFKRENPIKTKEQNKIEDIDEMLEGFNEVKGGK